MPNDYVPILPSNFTFGPNSDLLGFMSGTAGRGFGYLDQLLADRRRESDRNYGFRQQEAQRAQQQAQQQIARARLDDYFRSRVNPYLQQAVGGGGGGDQEGAAARFGYSMPPMSFRTRGFPT